MRVETTFLALVATQALHSVEEYTLRLYEVFPPARFVSGLISDNHERGFVIFNVGLVAFGVNERLYPNPPPFAEVLTGGGDRRLPTSPREWVPSSANTSVSGGGSGRRPLLSVRVGMHTGPVVIAEGGEVFGETANVTARVQSAAEPDTVVITAATQRLVAGMFVVEDRGRRPSRACVSR